VRLRSTFAAAAALLLAAAGSALAQEPTRITGRVLDATNRAVVSQAAVLVTGTTLGTQTSDTGSFVLHPPAGSRSLTIRRIGYRQAIVPLVAGQTDYTVLLDRDVLKLEQQVITGIATSTSSKNATTNDPVISGSQLNGAPTTTVENALQGKVAGALVSQNSGAPGGGLQVQMRGITSINANASPLYVVDGVQVSNGTFQSGLNAVTGSADNQPGVVGPSNQDQSVNRIADINPNDIESIQVLEGAAASSVYGNKAAGGVIIITTKKGQAGKPQIDATQKVGTFNLENEIDVRHYTLGEAYDQGIGAGLDSAQVLENYNECKGFCNNQKGLYGGGQLSYESDVDVRGGTNTTQYFASGLTKYDNGAQINTGYHKQTVRANLNQTIGNAITASMQATYTASQTQRGVNGNDNYGIAGYDVISYTPSWFDMAAHNPDGSFVTNPFGPANAYADAYQIQTPEQVSRFIWGGNVDWKVFSTPSQTLDFIVQGGADFASVYDQFYAPPTLQVEQEAPPYPGVSTYQSSYSQLSNYSASLVHKYSGLSWLSATSSIGLTRDKNHSWQVGNVGQNLIAGIQAFNLGTVQNQFYDEEEINDLSYYGSEQLLMFDEKLALTGGVNAERSSSDGGVNRFYVYPKISGSYRFTNIAPGTLDEVKIRAAYGEAGTTPNYGVKYDSVVARNYLGTNGVQYGLVKGDPDVRPETNTGIETGFDALLFHDRASFSATVYRKRITDLLLLAALPASSGYDEGWINGGQFTNYGLELNLQATPVQTGKFTWITGENFARVYSRVDQLPVPPFELPNVFAASPFGSNYVQVGSSVSGLFGYRTPGGSLVQLGDVQPAFTLGFSNDWSYGPLHLHSFFDWREGQSVANLTQDYFDAANNLADTVSTRLRTAAANNGLTPYAQHASFLKLRELTLKYDLPISLVNTVAKGYIRNAAISLSGRNLYTWTRYQGLDPEVSNFGNQQVSRAQDVTPYPPTRSYFISLDLGF
jgi:TonB-dependent starch-binding outer membrane protein SusC